MGYLHEQFRGKTSDGVRVTSLQRCPVEDIFMCCMFPVHTRDSSTSLGITYSRYYQHHTKVDPPVPFSLKVRLRSTAQVETVEVEGTGTQIFVAEGSPVAPAINVRVLDASNNPIKDVVVIAVLASQSGVTFPNYHIRQVHPSPPQGSSVLPCLSHHMR